jgi:DNA-binding MarR family transcriptional regulator
VKPKVNREIDRSSNIEYIASQLLSRANVLTRLITKQVSSDLPRTEASILNALNDSSRRITELADIEGLAQPTTTLLVKRLEERGWVSRKRQVGDARIVMVSLTAEGKSVLENYRARFSDLLRAHLAAATTDDQIASLVSTTEALESIIELLQQPRGTRTLKRTGST